MIVVLGADVFQKNPKCRKKSIELSVRGSVSPKTLASRRRVDVSSEVATLCECTVR